MSVSDSSAVSTATITPADFLAKLFPNYDGILSLSKDGADADADGTTDDFHVIDMDAVNAFVAGAGDHDVIVVPHERAYGPAVLAFGFEPGAVIPQDVTDLGVVLQPQTDKDGPVLVIHVEGDKPEIDHLITALAAEYPELSPDVPLPGRSWTLGPSSQFRGRTVGQVLDVMLEGYEEADGDAEGLSAEAAIPSIDGPPTGMIGPDREAELFGDISQEILDRQIIVSRASQKEGDYPPGKSKKGQPRIFAQGAEGKFSDFLLTNLTKIRTGEKDGICFVPGALVDGRRLNQAVTKLYMMGLDVDSGASMQDTMRKLQSMGLFFCAYTTHSHGKGQIPVKRDRFYKWATDNGYETEATVETVKPFLNSGDVKYTQDVINSISDVTTVHETSGIQLHISTKPFDKFRLLFVLEQPYVIAEQPGSQRDAIKAWGSMILGMGAALGISVDKAATDPARLFYSPSKAKNANNARVVVSAGKPLDWRSISKIDVAGTVSSDPFDQAASIMGGKIRGQILSPQKGLHLQKWASERAHGFQISQVFKDHCDENLKEETAPGKFTVICPFDDDHSNAGDPDDKGCFIQDAGMDAESFTFRCSHDSCAGHDRLAMLEKAMVDGWFTDGVLTDPAYDVAGVHEDAGGQDSANLVIEEVWNWVEKVKGAFVSSGKVDRPLVSRVAYDVAALGPDGVTVGQEVWDALDEAINATNSKPKLTKKDWDAVLSGARKQRKDREKANARLMRKSEARSGPKSGLDGDGWIQFSDDSQFFIAPYNGRPWVWRKGPKDGSDRPMCQHFRVTRVATAIGGKAQHLTITFPTPEGDMSVTIPRSDLGSYAKIGEALLDAGFTCADNMSVGNILMPLALAANALLIDRTGFAYGGHAFLRPDGRTVRHKSREVPATERPYLQSPGADRPSHLFTAGTPEGYINAIGPAFVDAKGVTRKPAHAAFDPGPFPNVALMALGAASGVIHTYANPHDGVLLASIVADSGSIKSIGALVFVAGSGNPMSDESGFFTWSATKAGLEVRLPRLSSCNLGLDELRSANDPKKVEEMLWMLFAGKGVMRSNNKLEEPKSRVFNGVCVLTSEELLADYFTRNKIDPPPGFDARVVSIKYTRAMIPSQKDPEIIKIITGFGEGARANYGHALEAAVNELLRMTAAGEATPDGVSKVLFGYRNELAAMVRDRQTMDDRAADLFATFRYSGELLQRLGFIPPDYDVEALVKWTWLNCRVAVRVSSTGDALVDHFRATIHGNADRVPEWSKDDWSLNGGDYRGALAWKSTKKVADEKRKILMITPNKLAEIAKDLTGGVSDLIAALEKIGALIPGSDAKTHRERGKTRLLHYQIDLDKLLKDESLKDEDE